MRPLPLAQSSHSKKQSTLKHTLDGEHRATCGCNKFTLDSHGDHVISTCKSHSGATKAHDLDAHRTRSPLPDHRAQGQDPIHSHLAGLDLVPCGPRASPLAQASRPRPQGITPSSRPRPQGITPSSGLKRGDLELVGCLSDAAGSRNLVLDLSITHDRIGSSAAYPHLNGTLSRPDTPDTPLNEAANRKLNKYRNHYANNHSISFLPATTSTSARMCGEFPFVFSFDRQIGRPRLTSPSWVRQRNLTRTSSASAARHSTQA
jgi:hypothetical protein